MNEIYFFFFFFFFLPKGNLYTPAAWYFLGRGFACSPELAHSFPHLLLLSRFRRSTVSSSAGHRPFLTLQLFSFSFVLMTLDANANGWVRMSWVLRSIPFCRLQPMAGLPAEWTWICYAVHLHCKSSQRFLFFESWMNDGLKLTCCSKAVHFQWIVSLWRTLLLPLNATHFPCLSTAPFYLCLHPKLCVLMWMLQATTV